jgi:SAM-dependent methyltransferase
MIDLAYAGERAVPWSPTTSVRIMHHHVMRYAWATQFVGGKRVVDLGCGTGYGSFMLSWVADKVIGLDKSILSIEFANANFRADNLDYAVGNVDKLQYEGVDVYVAFEVLEHLDDPQTLTDNLDATLIWSVPVLDNSAYHKHIYDPAQAALEFSGAIYWQSRDGTIARKSGGGGVGFQPHYILGVRE